MASQKQDLSEPVLGARELEADARDELAAFAAAWAGSVYSGSPFFIDLRQRLDGYRDAVEARVRDELNGAKPIQPPP